MRHSHSLPGAPNSLGTQYQTALYVVSLQAGLSECSVVSLCDPMDCSPQDSSAHGILQARILEWVAFPSPKEFPDSGTEPISPVSPVLVGRFLITEPPGDYPVSILCNIYLIILSVSLFELCPLS